MSSVTTTAVEVLKDAAAKGASLTRIPPLAVSFNVTGATTTLAEAAEATVEVSVVVNPVLDAALTMLGASRMGRRSWSFDFKDDTQLEGILESIYEGLWYPAVTVAAHPESKALYGSYNVAKMQKLVAPLLGVSVRGRHITHPNLCSNLSGHPWQHAGVTIKSARGGRRNIKVITNCLEFAGVNLDLMPDSAVKDPVALPAWKALEVLAKAEELGYVTLDPSGGMKAVARQLAVNMVALPLEGSFGEVRFVMGAAAKGATGFRAKDSRVARSEILSLPETLTRLQNVKAAGGSVVVASAVEELLAMEAAAPAGRTGLRGYQDLCVSLMRASKTGVLNAVAPGLGKTVITAVALAEEAVEKGGSHISLVVVPAGMRSQWRAELKDWHGAADVRIIASAKDVDNALEDLTTSSTPRIVVASYEMALSAEEELAKHQWDALVVDEAAVLRSGSTKRTQVLWRLRSCAKKAYALTGTPIDKSVDDLGRILGWVRNEEKFASSKLSKVHANLSREVQREALRSTLGPSVFRRDRSEIADELPSVSTEVVRMDPSPAEKALATAARTQLEQIYDDLVAKLAAAEALTPSDPRWKTVRDELAAARGAVLGGVTLARMAATDPQAVADSDSAGAMLLKSTGLVAKAVKAGGTKRRQLVDLTTDLVGRGERVLLFSDFSSVASNLAKDLEKNGVKVGTIMGGQSHQSRDEAAKAFMSGDVQALVLTAAAQEGLNLQVATVLVHVDLPWTPSAVVQRVGRASRIGSTASHLSVLIPLMADTIEERVAAVLIPRAMVAMSALDSGRVDDVANTELGVALSGLAAATSSSEADAKNVGILEMAREILK